MFVNKKTALENQRRKEIKDHKVIEEAEKQRDLVEKNKQRNLTRQKKEGRKDMFRSKKPVTKLYNQTLSVDKADEENQRYFNF